MKHIISAIPDDLMIRMVRRLKNDDRDEIVRAIERTGLTQGLSVNTDLIRRLVCLMRLPSEEWSEEDRHWSGELGKAEKMLMGVYSASVATEAILAHLAYFNKNDDYKRLYEESVAKLRWGPDLMTVVKVFLSVG